MYVAGLVIPIRIAAVPEATMLFAFEKMHLPLKRVTPEFALTNPSTCEAVITPNMPFVVKAVPTELARVVEFASVSIL
jgi:hypothetical protein